jgi:hypothetical protein
VPLARARGGASQEGLVSLLGAERMRSHFVVGVTTPNVKNRTFRIVAKTCRHPEAKCNTFLQHASI